MSDSAPPRSPAPAVPATTGWWWRWPPAVVLGGFLVAHVVEIALVRFDGRAYLSLRDWWGSPLGRVAASLVVVSLVVHSLFGIAHAWASQVGEPDRMDDPRTRAVVWFCACAVGVPLVVATLWPWVRTW